MSSDSSVASDSSSSSRSSSAQSKSSDNKQAITTSGSGERKVFDFEEIFRSGVREKFEKELKPSLQEAIPKIKTREEFEKLIWRLISPKSPNDEDICTKNAIQVLMFVAEECGDAGDEDDEVLVATFKKELRSDIEEKLEEDYDDPKRDEASTYHCEIQKRLEKIRLMKPSLTKIKLLLACLNEVYGFSTDTRGNSGFGDKLVNSLDSLLCECLKTKNLFDLRKPSVLKLLRTVVESIKEFREQALDEDNEISVYFEGANVDADVIATEILNSSHQDQETDVAGASAAKRGRFE
jgi:hypothetical protein